MITPDQDPAPDLTETEKRLAILRPGPIEISRDLMLFEAGRAAGLAEHTALFRITLMAGLALIAAGLGGLLIRERILRNDLEVKIASLDPEASLMPRVPPPTIDSHRSISVLPGSYLLLTRQAFSGEVGSPPSELPPVTGDVSSRSTTARPAPLQVREYGAFLEL